LLLLSPPLPLLQFFIWFFFFFVSMPQGITFVLTFFLLSSSLSLVILS
jgi:hypothetical protein